MKKFLVLFALLALTSCLDVDDFGAYWARTYIDTRLAGTWEQVQIDKPLKENAALSFVMDKGSYKVVIDKDGKIEDKPYYPVRTLAAGPYVFAVVGPKEGGMIRYQIKGTTLSFYRLRNRMAKAFLKKNFPADKFPDLNFHGGLKVGLMNDTTFKAISDIPDTPEYWQEISRYQRQSK